MGVLRSSSSVARSFVGFVVADGVFWGELVLVVTFFEGEAFEFERVGDTSSLSEATVTTGSCKSAIFRRYCIEPNSMGRVIQAKVAAKAEAKAMVSTKQ